MIGSSGGGYPSRTLIVRLAAEPDADADELLILAGKIPDVIRDRVLQRPDDFCKLASLDDTSLEGVIRHVDRRKKTRV